MQYEHNASLLVAEQLTTENHLPAKFVPLKANGVVGRSAPAVAAVAVGPAVIVPLPLVLPLAALILPLPLPPLTPLPSAVAGVEPAVAAAAPPPNGGVKLVAPPKAGKPKVTPEEGKVKPTNAGGSAAFPGGLGSAAGADDDAS